MIPLATLNRGAGGLMGRAFAWREGWEYRLG
jgi:hypothetical protein